MDFVDSIGIISKILIRVQNSIILSNFFETEFLIMVSDPFPIEIGLAVLSD